MYLTASPPFWNSVPIAFATSSPFQASVTFRRGGASASCWSASRPTKSWSKLTNEP